MAERNRGGRGRQARGGRGRGGVPETDREARVRDLRDVEVEEQRRRIQELERQLAEARLAVQSEDGEESHDPSEFEEEEGNPFGVLNQGRNQGERPGHQSFSQNFGMKIEIPEFHGKTHPDEFIDWLHTVDRVFDIKDLTEEQENSVFDEDPVFDEYEDEQENLVFNEEPVFDESDSEQEDADAEPCEIFYIDSDCTIIMGGVCFDVDRIGYDVKGKEQDSEKKESVMVDDDLLLNSFFV